MSIPIHPFSLRPDTTVKNSWERKGCGADIHRFIRDAISPQILFGGYPLDIRVGRESARRMADQGVPCLPRYKHVRASEGYQAVGVRDYVCY